MCQGANCSELCVLIDRSLESFQVRREVLRQEERLMQFVNCVLARRRLKERACQNLDRRRAVKARNFIVEIMQYSHRIWRGGSPPPPPGIYEEALVRSWEWFSQNLCSYEPERSSFITWFNYNLNFRILDVTREQQTKAARQYQPPETGEAHFDLLERLLERLLENPTAVSNDGALLIDQFVAQPIDASLQMDKLIELVQLDLGRTLRNCYMQQHIHVTCQRLILRIWETIDISPSIRWNQLAGEFKVDREQLRQFYRNRCRPCFEKFLRDNKISN
jgi:hypothetical protein